MDDIRKILYLVPDAVCENYKGKVTKWLDLRARPTQSQIDAVLDQDVIDNENSLSQESKFNQDAIKAVGLTMKDFMNEIIAGRTAPITNSELKVKFKTYL